MKKYFFKLILLIKVWYILGYCSVYFEIKFRIRAGKYSEFDVCVDLAKACCVFCFCFLFCLLFSGLSALHMFLLTWLLCLEITKSLLLGDTTQFCRFKFCLCYCCSTVVSAKLFLRKSGGLVIKVGTSVPVVSCLGFFGGGWGGGRSYGWWFSWGPMLEY